MRFASSLKNGLICLLFLFVVLACSQQLPTIADPEKLVADCSSLVAESSDGAVDRAKWPASVTLLEPISVERRGKQIIILVYQKTGEPAAGYLITAGGQPSMDHFKLAQKYPGIWSCTQIP